MLEEKEKEQQTRYGKESEVPLMGGIAWSNCGSPLKDNGSKDDNLGLGLINLVSPARHGAVWGLPRTLTPGEIKYGTNWPVGVACDYTPNEGEHMKRMEWARANGYAKAGPGRPSRACLDAIQAQRDAGVVFDDDVPSKPVVSREPHATVTVTRKPTLVAGENVGSMADTRERYDMSAKFTGLDSTGKKQTVGTPTVCRRSGYSILGCYCAGPGHEVLVASMEVVVVTEKG